MFREVKMTFAQTALLYIQSLWQPTFTNSKDFRMQSVSSMWSLVIFSHSSVESRGEKEAGRWGSEEGFFKRRARLFTELAGRWDRSWAAVCVVILFVALLGGAGLLAARVPAGTQVPGSRGHAGGAVPVSGTPGQVHLAAPHAFLLRFSC